jgi:hypothetical protein
MQYNFTTYNQIENTIRSTVGASNLPATQCSECLIQKVWYKRLSGLSRVGDIMEDADVAATTVAANFAFKSYAGNPIAPRHAIPRYTTLRDGNVCRHLTKI